MKRVVYAAVMALGCTVAAAAQSGMGSDKMPKDKMAKDAAKTVMVTGCVAESGGHYMLNNAMMPDMAGQPMSYQLTGGTLKPHVGHKVEVTGTMKPMPKDGMGKDGMGKDSMGKDSMGKDSMGKDSMGKEGMSKDPMAKEGMAKDDMKKDGMAMGGSLAVKSLKMVAPTCS